MDWMDGISVADTVITESKLGFWVTTGYIVVGILLVFGGIGVLAMTYSKVKNLFHAKIGCTSSSIMIIVGFSMLIGADKLLYGWLGSMEWAYEPTGEYKVTVAETVDMNEFYERYDVIALNEGVYTVRIREDVA